MYNDMWFNSHYVNGNIKITPQIVKLIMDIDGAKYVGDHRIIGRFNSAAIPITEISTGCKTAINILTFKNEIFYLGECGANALGEICKLKDGNGYINYYCAPKDMKNKVEIVDYNDNKIIVRDEYEMTGILEKIY